MVATFSWVNCPLLVMYNFWGAPFVRISKILPTQPFVCVRVCALVAGGGSQKN